MPAQEAPVYSAYSAGVRSGFSSSDYPRPLVQSELFGKWLLPREQRLGSDWSLRPRLEVTLGSLCGHEEIGFVGTVGPALVLKYDRLPIAIDAGVRPTVISREAFADRDFGIPFQFTSHGGLEWDINARWKLSYRFQHMSNAGLGGSNPGLNTHMFGIEYKF